MRLAGRLLARPTPDAFHESLVDPQRHLLGIRHRDGVLVPDRTGGMIQANQAASGEKDTE